jgi:hypothetical protein
LAGKNCRWDFHQAFSPSGDVFLNSLLLSFALLPFCAASAVQAAKAGIDSMLDSFIASQGMPEDDASEIRAISLALSRSITRRAQVGFVLLPMDNSSLCDLH